MAKGQLGMTGVVSRGAKGKRWGKIGRWQLIEAKANAAGQKYLNPTNGIILA